MEEHRQSVELVVLFNDKFDTSFVKLFTESESLNALMKVAIFYP